MQSNAAEKLDRVQNGSALYDLSRYEVQEPERRPELTVRTSRRRSQVSPWMLFCCVALTVALISLTIYTNVVKIELGDQLSQSAAELELLKSETVLLQSKLESATSVKAVEEYATANLSMGKVDKYQVTYVQLSEGDKIEKTDKAPDRTPEQQLLKWLGEVVEYLNIQ